MYKNLLIFAGILLMLPGLTISCNKTEKKVKNDVTVSEANQNIKVKPFRVLVIIGDQWTDPMSYHIDTKRVQGHEFIDVVTMLKIWGVPFDILRLDEQRLQINRFLDGEAKPNYGCVIWMADPDKLQGYSANYQTLKRAVNEYGISMIALFDNIKTKQIAELVGVNYQGTETVQVGGTKEMFLISGEHFITEGKADVKLPDPKRIARPSIPNAAGKTPEYIEKKEDLASINIVRCTSTDSVKVLGSVGQNPQFVVRDIDNDTKVVWIGGGKDWFLKYTVMREFFRKALVYSIGYGIFNDNFGKGYIFIMDDVGCSEHAWSLRWHYPTPTKEVLLKYLIEPLEKNGCMMVINTTSGYADPEKQIIVSPWTVKPFKDIFGNWQDYGSTKEGLEEGLRRGVFELQPHRAWSHMNWDLDSPPGPWWGTPVDGELAVGSWYTEIVDARRGWTPVPSNDLLFIYKSGIDAIKKSFGVVPLAAEVRLQGVMQAAMKAGKNGGDDNGRVAAIAGIGVSRECYVGFDRTIEFSMMMPEQFTFHDLDLTLRTDDPADLPKPGKKISLGQLTVEECMSSKIAGGRSLNLTDNLEWIESHKDKHWMGFNETCAYLHTSINSTVENGIEFFYDDHYCRHFEKKPSVWTLEFSDDFRQNIGADVSVVIDGKIKLKSITESQQVQLPAGLGTHRLGLLY